MLDKCKNPRYSLARRSPPILSSHRRSFWPILTPLDRWTSIWPILVLATAVLLSGVLLASFRWTWSGGRRSPRVSTCASNVRRTASLRLISQRSAPLLTACDAFMDATTSGGFSRVCRSRSSGWRWSRCCSRLRRASATLSLAALATFVSSSSTAPKWIVTYRRPRLNFPPLAINHRHLHRRSSTSFRCLSWRYCILSSKRICCDL